MNTRNSDRARLEVEITLESEHNFYTGITCDVSEGGVFVATYVPPAMGSMVEMDLKLPHIDAVFHMMGVVRWTRDFKASCEGCPPGCGIEWIDISYGALVAIQAFVEQRDSIYFEAA